MQTDTTIPYHEELERTVLCECFIEPESLVKQLIEAGEGLFYKPQYQVIFKAIETLHEHGETINQETASEMLKEAGQLDLIGGDTALEGILNETYSAANALSHIEILKAYSARRKLHTLAKVTIAACESNTASPVDIAGNIETQLIDIKELIKGKRKNLTEDIREWVNGTDGDFYGTDVDKYLQIGTKRDKKNRKKILQRLCKDGLIEKASSKQGHYRVVNSECEIIDWLNAPTDPFDISLPLGIDAYVKIFPGNLIVIAGESNAGKTAFLLNLVKLNMKKHDIHYFSSEMGREEFAIRLNEFDDVELKDWKFHPKERSGDFADVILPDAINIIDFLEMHDEFYKVGGHLKKITDKLGRGLAIVAIQKNKGAGHGLGGARSIERARLYLIMEPGKLTIKKAKIYRHRDINPNGLETNFKLIHGCKFIPDDAGWHPGEEGL